MEALLPLVVDEGFFCKNQVYSQQSDMHVSRLTNNYSVNINCLTGSKITGGLFYVRDWMLPVVSEEWWSLKGTHNKYSKLIASPLTL